MRDLYHHSVPPARGRDNLKNLRAVLPYLSEFRGRASIALGCLFMAKVATVAVPLVLKEIVDALDAGMNASITLPIALLIGYGLLRLSTTGFNAVRDAVFAKLRYRTMRRLSDRVIRHLHSLALRYHLERKTGAISRDLERGTKSLSSIMNFLVFNILPTAAEFLLVTGILLFNYDISFVLVTLGTIAVYIVFTLKVTEWRMQFRYSMNTFDSQANNQAVDSLINYETVKYFGNEAFEVERYDNTLADWERDAVKTQTSMSVLNFGQGAIIAIGVTLIMIIASHGVTTGSLTIGDLVLVNAFLLQLFLPLNFLGVVYRQLKHSLVDMDLLLTLLAERPEIEDKARAPSLTLTNGEIAFDHVSFGYNPDREILHNVHFVVPAGKKVAVVGPSGAGKSTLARLLFRFFDVNQGRILVDGQDIRDVTQKSLRSAIGIVPQDTVLFNDTIFYNIAYARPDAERKHVIRAAKLAHIHDFIAGLPQDYDTVVGERGLKLSGGEKQRVAIARVILKNPRILIFDEATSALDSSSELAIQSALEEVAADHTTLVIAHRLSTIVDANTILVMDNGRIAERGSHRELLAKGGMYARMWTLQKEEREHEAAIDDAPLTAEL